jgi:CCR4-NOT transcription complex subunit 4
MFLHEPGEENDSFTRQDLSSMNVVSTQRPAQSAASSSTAPPERLHGQTQPQPQPPLQQAPASVTTSSQPMRRQLSKDDTASPTDSGDGSALPSTASWAAKGMQQQGGRTSQPASVSTPSPRTNNATIPSQVRESNKTESGRSSVQAIKRPPSQQSATLATQSTASTPHPKLEPLDEFSQKFIDLVKSIRSPHFKFIFSKSVLTSEDYEAIIHMPPLFDSDGGTKRRIAREKEEEERRKRDEEAQGALQLVEAQSDDQPESGSLQLGGEPEISQDAEGTVHGNKPGMIGGQSQQRQAIQSSQQQLLNSNGHHSAGMGAFGQSHALAGNISNLSINGRGLTPQQQQQLLLIKSGTSQPGNFLEQFQSNNPSGVRMNTPSNNQFQQHQQLNLFQNQLGSQGHTRQSSRYTFANDSSSASAAVKPAINPQHMAQQTTMMPATSNFNSQQHQGQPPQHLANQFYSSSLQGPPPGLKSSGTPPISGGGMFGQGHGFGTSVGSGLGLGGANSSNKDGSEFLREMLSRNRGTASGAGSGQGADAGKREFMFPAFLNQYPSSSTPAPAPGLLGGLYGPQPGAYQDLGPQKQKKKGKKHRHANTSSSGGGGLVDLADPSILQARMQQQGGAGAGQGLFGGQGQGGYNPGSMYGGGFGAARW